MSIIEAILITIFLGIGTARMAAIISIDEISEPLRDYVFLHFPPEDNDENGWFYQGMRRATSEESWQMESWDIPDRQKGWWSIQSGDDTKPREPHFIGKLIGCHKCMSVWIAAGNVALFFIWRDAAIVLNLVTAISFVASAADSKWYK